MRTARTERHWRLLSPVLLEQQDLFIVPAKVDLFDSLMFLCKQCLSVCFSSQSLLLSRTSGFLMADRPVRVKKAILLSCTQMHELSNTLKELKNHL